MSDPRHPKTRRSAVLYALYRDARICAYSWPVNHVVAQIETWRHLREQATRPRRRRIYDALIQGALYGAAYEPAWSKAWRRRAWDEVMPVWAIKGLGQRLVDDLHEQAHVIWQSTITRTPDRSVADVYDCVHIPGEGWHSWTVKSGQNAVYHGCAKDVGDAVAP